MADSKEIKTILIKPDPNNAGAALINKLKGE
jgi:hypothetical protein